MKLKSAAGLNLYVTDLEKTVAFYETLGFLADKRDDRHASVRLNWFWIDFIAQDKEERDAFKHETSLTTRGDGVILHVSVDDPKAAYAEVMSNGIVPENEPSDWAGNREFIVRDPDGYKIAIFKRTR